MIYILKLWYNFNELKYLSVPNVIGLDLKEARENLKGFKIEYSGSGSKVFYQSPSAGDRVLEGSTIKLMLKE